MLPESNPGWDPIARATRQYCLRVYGCEPMNVRIQLLHGPEVILPMPQWGIHSGQEAAPPAPVTSTSPPEPLRTLIVIPGAGAAPVPLERQRIRKAWHSPDWREIHLEGRRWVLTPKPAVIVRILYEAALEGRPDVDQSHLLRKAESDCLRLPDLFRRIQGWEQLIVSVEPAKYRLSCADSLQDLLEEERRREEGSDD